MSSRQTNGKPLSRSDPGAKVSQIAPALIDYYFVVSLVLGGCCSNVLAYERLLKINPNIGSALTFSQMLFITAQTLPSFLSWSDSSFIPQLKPRQVPLSQWALQVLVNTSSSLLNNWAFAFNVPFTLQIVFRSAGLAVSMLFGRFFLNRRYSLLQVASVILVSVGVILATLSRAPSSSPALNNAVKSPDAVRRYAIGVTMLVASLLLTGLMGLLQEKTYRKYGPCWKEGVFYTHFLALPIFTFLIGDVKQGISSLGSPGSSYLSYLILAGNLVSQLICVSGVNRLSSQVSSVSTNLVLTARKATSLCLSVWWFGNGWNLQLAIGAGMVFFGSFLFTTGSEARKNEQKKTN